MQKEFQSIRIDADRCRGRMACMHVCPTQAIRVRNRKATLLRERCIDCGECVRVCPNGAIAAQTSSFSDFARFKCTVAIPSPVLYSQFGKDVPPSAVLAALKRVGFSDAYDAACASEAVSIAIQEYLDTVDSPRPLISPFCPAIVRLIQIRYPNLLDHLIPIESPMEIAAREAKHLKMQELGLKASEIGAIYITPCPAKMLAIKQPPRKRHSFVDGTIAISDIYLSVLRALPDVTSQESSTEIRGLGLGWPIVGGQVACLKAEDCLAIGGLNDAVRIFDEIENGKLRDVQYIEAHSCPTACVGGSLTVENSYIARGRVLRTLGKFGGKPCQDREKIDEDVSKALEKLHQKQQFYERLPKIDCGACGSPTCLTFAEDVVKGDATAEECVFISLKSLIDRVASMQEHQASHDYRSLRQ
jgi:iron only hydrogenase large subunit-like protein